MKSKRRFFVPVLILQVLLSACSLPLWLSQAGMTPDEAAFSAVGTEEPTGRCGDGLCGELEQKRGVCPDDCLEEEPAVQAQPVQPAAESVLYFGFMVHLEGWTNEVTDRDMFDRHMQEALKLASIFEQYGAVVTFEASPETIAANATWENVLLELENRGHSIGIHADAGVSSNPAYNQRLFTTEITEMKRSAEALGLTIQHVSGICSDLDWVKAAVDAGYQFTTGGAGYCAMSMPESMRPPEYAACANPGACHGLMPLAMEDRIHPWRTGTAYGDWTRDDPAGELVILSSDGGIKNLYEASTDPQASHGDMAYTPEDIMVVVEKVEEALSLAEPGQVNSLYFSLSIGAAHVEQSFYKDMFETLQPYVDSGQLVYATMNEMYEVYAGN